MSNVGFTCKETAAILNLCHPAKASQAMEPAWRKVARHWRVDPERTIQAIIDHAARLEAMTDAEVDSYQRLSVNKVNSDDPTCRRRYGHDTGARTSGGSSPSKR